MTGLPELAGISVERIEKNLNISKSFLWEVTPPGGEGVVGAGSMSILSRLGV